MMCSRLLCAAIAVALGLTASPGFAQCGCVSAQAAYAPVAPSYTAYYAPGVTSYQPSEYVTYYTPATTVADYAPVVQPYATYYAPVTQPYATYYAPVTQPYATYYAPVTQPYATYYAPASQSYATYYGTVGASVYGTPKVYVPGQPVRNVVRAITP